MASPRGINFATDLNETELSPPSSITYSESMPNLSSKVTNSLNSMSNNTYKSPDVSNTNNTSHHFPTGNNNIPIAPSSSSTAMQSIWETKYTTLERARNNEKLEIKEKLTKLNQTISELKSTNYSLEKENLEIRHSNSLLSTDNSKYCIEIDQLKLTITRLETIKNDYNNKYHHTNNDIIILTQQRDETISKYENLNKQFDNYKQQYKILQTKYQHETTEYKNHQIYQQQELEKTQLQLKDREEEVNYLEIDKNKIENNYKNEIQMLQKQIQSYKLDIQKLNDINNKLHEDSITYQQNVMTLDKTNNELKMSLQRQDETFKSVITSDRTKAQSEIASLIQRIKTLEHDKITLSEKIPEISGSITEKEMAILELQEQIMAFHQKEVDKNEVIQTLQLNLSHHENDANTSKSKEQELELKLTTLIEEHLRETTELERKYQQQLTDLTKKHDLLEIHFNQIQENYHRSVKEHSELVNENARLNSFIQSTRQERSQLEETHDMVQDKYHFLELEHSNLKSKYEIVVQDKNQLLSKYMIVQKQHEQLESMLQEKESQYELSMREMEDRIIALEEELQILGQQYDESCRLNEENAIVIDNLKEKLSSTEEKNQQLQSTLHHLKETFQLNNKEKQSIIEQYEARTKQYEDNESQVTHQHHQTVIKLMNEINDMEKHSQDKQLLYNQEKLILESKITELTDKVKQQQIQLSETKSQFQQEKKSQSMEILKIKSQLEQFQLESKTKEMRIEELLGNNESLQKKLASMKEKMLQSLSDAVQNDNSAYSLPPVLSFEKSMTSEMPSQQLPVQTALDYQFHQMPITEKVLPSVSVEPSGEVIESNLQSHPFVVSPTPPSEFVQNTRIEDDEQIVNDNSKPTRQNDDITRTTTDDNINDFISKTQAFLQRKQVSSVLQQSKPQSPEHNKTELPDQSYDNLANEAMKLVSSIYNRQHQPPSNSTPADDDVITNITVDPPNPIEPDSEKVNMKKASSFREKLSRSIYDANASNNVSK